MKMYDADGEKKKTKTKKDETKEKFPVWLPSHPHPVYENGGRLFSGVRKQPGPTLGGTGGLV